MKKLIVIAFLCIIGVGIKAQSISLRDSYPSYNNESSYATAPILTLDSLTGYLHYSFTVNYPNSMNISDVHTGGTYLSLGIALLPYGSIINLVDFNNETEDYRTLPTGQVVYSGSVYIGDYYAITHTLFISAGHGFTYFSDPNFPYPTNHGFYTYDEYDVIP
ncbi:hypothetical protein EZ428_08330 [Pedobacter frigiditerrae]|uniref:Uncharacterized protein n=1 Tax=Pedobacter frigiditerrae TaxID=2530452 RepID=A0A4R0MWW2_9SPHI|nr:hypothetical protein [Pedobacter frigiditerrae]TCC91751.1 hypothetical protein EZ428_08330 [Pedobacter frigiditerrae]